MDISFNCSQTPGIILMATICYSGTVAISTRTISFLDNPINLSIPEGEYDVCSTFIPKGECSIFIIQTECNLELDTKIISCSTKSTEPASKSQETSERPHLAILASAAVSLCIMAFLFGCASGMLMARLCRRRQDSNRPTEQVNGQVAYPQPQIPLYEEVAEQHHAEIVLETNAAYGEVL